MQKITEGGNGDMDQKSPAVILRSNELLRTAALIARLMLLALLCTAPLHHAYAQSGACVEDGGVFECADPKIIKESRTLCFEAGAFMPSINAAVACGWAEPTDSDAAVSQKAACWYAGGCTATVELPQWSLPGQNYRSNLCWNVQSEANNGVATQAFAILNGSRQYTPQPQPGKPQPPACSATGAVPESSVPVVALLLRELGCEAGWNRYQANDGFECRRTLVIPPKICESCPDLENPGPGFQDGSVVGNPIVTLTSEKRQRETDYVDYSPHPLTFERIHRSSWVTKSD